MIDLREQTTRQRLEAAFDANTPRLDFDFDAVESVQLSRYQRPRPLRLRDRILGSGPRYDDVIQVQLRSARAELARFEALCHDTALLEQLTWLNHEGLRVEYPRLARSVIALVDEAEVRLELGELRDKPPELGLFRGANRAQREALQRARAVPSSTAWDALCDALDRCNLSDLKQLAPRLEHLLASWPELLRSAPDSWLRVRIRAPQSNPRLAFCSPAATATHLHFLDLSYLPLGPVGAEVVAGQPHFAGLRSINLHGASIGDRGVEALATSPHLTQLKVLNLASNRIRAQGALALAQSPNLAQIESLYLSNNAIGDRGTRALLESQGLPRLTTLTLAENGIQTLRDQDGLEHRSALRYLDLSHNRLSHHEVMTLIRSPDLPVLTTLRVSSDAWEPAAQHAITAEAGRRGLEILL